jgi:hypothetical protein
VAGVRLGRTGDPIGFIARHETHCLAAHRAFFWHGRLRRANRKVTERDVPSDSPLEEALTGIRPTPNVPAVRDYYDLIGLRRDAGADEVRRACRRVAAFAPWDEDVAIDFPSTARVMERIRASFFGDTASTGLVAEISLSQNEALAGADVPLLLPTRRVCPSCGGRGEVWLDACAPCAGTGELVAPRQIRVSLPAGTEDGAHFRFALSSQGGPATAIEIRVAVR